MIVHMELETETIRVVMRHDEEASETNAQHLVLILPEDIMVFDEQNGDLHRQGKGIGKCLRFASKT